MLTCKSHDRGPVVILSVAGNLDALTVSEFRTGFESVLTSAERSFVLDMSGVELVDSTGVGAIISLFKRLKTRGCVFKVAGISGQPKEIFDLLRLHRALDLHPSVDDAVASCSSS